MGIDKRTRHEIRQEEAGGVETRQEDKKREYKRRRDMTRGQDKAREEAEMRKDKR